MVSPQARPRSLVTERAGKWVEGCYWKAAIPSIQRHSVERTEGRKRSGVSTTEVKRASPDSALVLGILAGDENAMAELYDRYSGIVYSVALRVLGDATAAEDTLQEVFMQLWRNPQAFDASRGSLPAWLAVITRNRAIDSVRKRRPEAEMDEVMVSVEPDLASDADRQRALEKIRGTLAGMPAVQRTALELAFFEGLTHSEIAARTKEPLGTVKTRIRSGLLLLRKAFQP
jgi:RNA polymerase sigma-70 factor, ECF subfamily